jgi:hypothetical protein
MRPRYVAPPANAAWTPSPMAPRLPDFLIVGAMKSGTTSLHHILAHHESVFMPVGEVYFFSVDDVEQHPEFFLETSNGWSSHDYEKCFERYLSWYGALFRDAHDGQLIGERSTSYMASKKAPERIARLLPAVKLIFMLRDPVLRAYAHYWHLVRTGRAIYSFEQSIQYTPGTLLQRSYYSRQIKRFKHHFPDESMRFVVFEAFVSHPQHVVDEICEWLGLEDTVNTRVLDTRRNRGAVPRSPRLQIAHNRLFRRLAAERYVDSGLPGLPSDRSSLLLRAISFALRKANLTTKSDYPAMKTTTRAFLETLFRNENRGLSELINVDVGQYWPYMKE